MHETWYALVLSSATITALISTGAFIQKSRDNSSEILTLKIRCDMLEKERVEIATLNNRMQNIESRFSDHRDDMKSGFDELKVLIRTKTTAILELNAKN